MATVGSDFEKYLNWLDKNKISHQYIHEIQEALWA